MRIIKALSCFRHVQILNMPNQSEHLVANFGDWPGPRLVKLEVRVSDSELHAVCRCICNLDFAAWPSQVRLRIPAPTRTPAAVNLNGHPGATN